MEDLNNLSKKELIKKIQDLEKRNNELERTNELNKEAQLAQEIYKSIFRLSPGLIVVSRLEDGSYYDVSYSYSKLFGFTRKEILDSSSLGLNVWHDPRDRDFVKDLLNKYGHYNSVEIEYKRKDGSPFICLQSAELIEIEGEKYIIGVFLDITDRVFTERRMLEASENERRRIGMELHDNLAHRLLEILIKTNLLARDLEDSDEKYSARAYELEELVGESMKLARSLAKGLSPTLDSIDSLQVTMSNFRDTMQKRFHIHCGIHIEDEIEITDSNYLRHIYYIAEEAVVNAVRHGKATEIEVRLYSDKERFCLQVIDNGGGISEGHGESAGLGLKFMKTRARIINGTIFISNRKDQKGGVVTCKFFPPGQRRSITA